MKFRFNRALLFGMSVVFFCGLAVLWTFNRTKSVHTSTLSASAIPQAPVPTAAMFDTALHILQDFVRAGDRRLGFGTIDSVYKAYIDTARGLPIFYAAEDSFVLHGLDTGGILDIHRKIYPVYSRTGTLHSAITFRFDSVPQAWVPVEFTDSGAVSYILSHPTQNDRSTIAGQFVVAPFLQSTFYVFTAKDRTKKVIIPYHLVQRFGPHLPPNVHDPSVLSEGEFDTIAIKYTRRRRIIEP